MQCHLNHLLIYLGIFIGNAYASSTGEIIKNATIEEDNKWDVNVPLGPVENLEFTTTEGTWMNLDVSPDGTEIIFDMLGDIYSIPIDGGTAKLLRGGPAFEVQPRFSPDGSQISFTSDHDGGDNVWIMNRDSSEAKAITTEDFRLLNNAVWTPDGEYLIARKHFTSGRSLGAGEMWMYHRSGGKGLQLTKRKNDQQDAGEPWVSPDGRYLYYSEDMSGGSTFEYNKDPNGIIYVIRRLDLVTGKLENFVSVAGGSIRPQVSPDGKYLAFVRRVRLKTVLYLFDLKTGETFPVYDNLSKDQQETWAIFGVYPNYAWTPNSKNIVIYAKGHIWNIDINSKSAIQIPFEVNAKHTINQALKFKQDVSPNTFESKMIRHTVTSPDGKWLVFQSVGHLWKKELPDKTPIRLTKDEHFEFEPSFSSDGKWIVYTTWSNENLGAIYKIRLNGRSKKKLTQRPGYYYSPSFSHDSKKIVYERRSGNPLIGFTHGLETGLYWMDAEGKQIHFIQDHGRKPRFNKTGDRIFFLSRAGEDKQALKSVRIDQGEERTHFTSKYAVEIVPSPNEEWVAFTELFNAYITPFPKTGSTIDLSGDSKAIPVKKVTQDAGNYLHWSGDSNNLHWTIGAEYFTRELKNTFAFMECAPDDIPKAATKGIQIGLELDTDIPTGILALTGARIITMNGDEVIRNGVVVINQNRIQAVGKPRQVNIPDDAKVIDVTGKTIMPGIIDVHAHLRDGYSKISPQQHWSYMANVSFGVTTAHDPSADTEMVFSHSEMVKAGKLVGPRIYSTGTILYGAEGNFKAVINSYEDALSHLRRMKAVGAFSVKSYNQPRRNQRQQVIKGARELEMMVYPEGGSFFYHNMSMILDGHTGVEHAIPVNPFYKDVRTLWGNSDTGYTPTLVVGYGGIWGENYWYQKTNVWENKRLMTFTPRPIVDGRSRRRIMIPDDDFNHFEIAKGCKQLINAGGKVQLGAHGQLQGLGAHWELWMLEQGGMTELEALRAATINGAYYIGMDHEIGSIEKGKLADLLVLNQNPLDNIRNSESIEYVMINGRIYDANSMNETGNHPKRRKDFYWEKGKINDAYVWKGLGVGFDHAHCACFGTH